GKGLCYILDGMLSVFRDGKIIELETEKEKQGDDASDGEFFKNAAAEFDTDIRFTYCTEFIIGRSAGCERDPQELRTFLETIGDCVLVVADEEIIKVHVHTENPGKALEAALGFGQLLKVKVDNMKEQHRKAAEQAKQAPAKAEAAEELQPAEPSQEIGFVAVAAGDGLESLFKDLGCTHVVSGGQTMNPS
ncbi:MAG TPA: dihydroxyacetone kinase, partial [Ruminococcaceae bacterium]|nr:dihydroxyacetone kinase [Oscillospiraceae bacterium]